MVPANALLDLADGIGQVSATVEHRVVSPMNETIGKLEPLEPTSIEGNTESTDKRSLNGLLVTQTDLADVDPFADRLQPTYVLEDGSEWPCGVFYFVDDVTHDDTGTITSGLALRDGDCLLNDPFLTTFAIPPFGDMTSAANEIADQVGIMWREIPDAGAVCADPMVWPARTTRKQALAAICAAAGWLPPYFDNRGWLIIRPIPDLTRAAPDQRYDRDGGRVLRATVMTRSNLLSAPNRHVVTNNGPTNGEISAEASVDQSLPFSRERRGRTITAYHDQQGIGSTAQAAQMAARFASVDPRTFLTVEFTSTPDPRHDLFQIIGWDGVNMREVSYSLPLNPGRDVSMRHVLTRGGFTSE